MALKYALGALSLLSGTVLAAPSGSNALLQAAPRSASSSTRSTAAEPGKLQLIPVSTSSNKAFGVGRNVVPKKSLALAWQTPANDSVVSLGLTMQNTAVNLEDVDDVSQVDCSGNSSVAVTFANAEAFEEALAAWGGMNDSFVMITNHMGDCDSELERSFFVADSDTLASFASNFTIVAKAEKSDLVSTASATTIDFASQVVPNAAVDKRGIKMNEESLSIAYNLSLPSAQTIVDTDYVTVILNEAYVNNSVRYSGHAEWQLFKGVTSFYIDIDKSVHHYASFEVDVTDSLTKTWSWAPDALTYSLLEVPGIIRLGPSAGVSFGGTLTAEAEGSLTAQFTSQMPNGTIHIDFVDWDSSYSNGWETEHDAIYNVTEDVTLTIKPYVDFTVEFACSLFNGLVDLSTGVKVEPSFPFITTASATQVFNTTSGNLTSITFPNETSHSGACANGLNEEIEFQFDVVAFATEWIDITLYEYKVDLWQGCLNWLTRRG